MSPMDRTDEDRAPVKRCQFCEQDHEVQTSVVLGFTIETCDLLPGDAVWYDA